MPEVVVSTTQCKNGNLLWSVQAVYCINMVVMWWFFPNIVIMDFLSLCEL